MHKDISGQKFGMLTALHLVEPHVSPNGKRITMWMCKCECGNTKAIRYSSLVNGETKSCGCATKKFISMNNNKHHWLSRSRLYEIWIGMKKRCYNPSSQFYYCYGGRGITVCDEWLNDFFSFRRWALGNGYNDTLTIDRIDASGNYEPANCRWATEQEQANNRPTWNQILTLNGVEHNVTEWANLLGVKADTLFKRKRAGWSDERILTEPIHKCKRKS